MLNVQWELKYPERLPHSISVDFKLNNSIDFMTHKTILFGISRKGKHCEAISQIYIYNIKVVSIILIFNQK